MAKRLIDPKERKALRDRIELLDSIELDTVKDIIRPYIDLDYEAALEQAVSRIAKNIVSSIKDERGIRKFYSCGKSDFVNVDVTKDIKALRQVDAQLSTQYKGVSRARTKVRNNMKKVIDGQIGMFQAVI